MEEDEEDTEVEVIEVGIEVPIIKHKEVLMIGNRVPWRTSPHKKTIIKLIIGIHLKLSVTLMVELGTTKMDVLFEVIDKTQTTEGLAEGATARP